MRNIYLALALTPLLTGTAICSITSRADGGQCQHAQHHRLGTG